MTLAHLTDWREPVYQCVTGRDGERRPRATAHAGRHLDGCKMVAKCGCVKRYYSSFYNKRHGFHYHNPDKSFYDVLHDGRCETHWRAYHEYLQKVNA